MSKRHKRNDEDMAYREIELSEPMTREDFITSLEEFASKENAVLLYNTDGTFTIVSPDGGQITTGQIGA